MGAAQSIVFTIASSLLTSILTRNGISTTCKFSRAKPVTLDAAQRQSVEAAIRETCKFRQWNLHALNVRTNHIHAVIAIGLIKPERALTALKANSTRQMREDGCWQHGHSPWAEKGSKRHLWNERSVSRAIEYVLYGQGDELPDFDKD